MTDRLQAALEAAKEICVLCPDPDFPSDDCEDCAGQGRYLTPAVAELAAALRAEYDPLAAALRRGIAALNEGPHEYCGCSYCRMKAALAAFDAAVMAEARGGGT